MITLRIISFDPVLFLRVPDKVVGKVRIFFPMSKIDVKFSSRPSQTVKAMVGGVDMIFRKELPAAEFLEKIQELNAEFKSQSETATAMVESAIARLTEAEKLDWISKISELI